jgi:phosphoadenosine phosphosulfate reductase
MSLAARLNDLEQKHSHLEGEALISAFYNVEFRGKMALVSSFGTEAALLLSMVSKVDKNAPVLFLDTVKLFPETLAYKDTLINHLGLTNVKTFFPDYIDVNRDDPEGNLWESKPNHCCYIRKVKPLNKALKGFDAWITGRKRMHGGLRADLPIIEYFEGHFKINPLAAWPAERIMSEFQSRKLPEHPLIAQGYTSVGCMPCTSLPTAEGDVRSGRWAGQEKTECGIHMGSDGKFTRAAK